MLSWTGAVLEVFAWSLSGGVAGFLAHGWCCPAASPHSVQATIALLGGVLVGLVIALTIILRRSTSLKQADPRE